MASEVDATFPSDDEKVDKAQMRQQFLVIKNELSELQRMTRLPWLIATGQESV